MFIREGDEVFEYFRGAHVNTWRLVDAAERVPCSEQVVHISDVFAAAWKL